MKSKDLQYDEMELESVIALAQISVLTSTCNRARALPRLFPGLNGQIFNGPSGRDHMVFDNGITDTLRKHQPDQSVVPIGRWR